VISVARLSDEALVELARRLKTAETGGWVETALRELVAGLGWEWRDRVEPLHREHYGPVLSTGLVTGDAYLRSVRRHMVEDYVAGEEYFGLYVPIDLPQDTPIAKADAFRRAAEVLTAAFGSSSIMGAYGSPGPFHDVPASWGSPFRRWRGDPNSLELRAGEQGPELLLSPSAPVENWYRRQPHDSFALGGFFGTRNDPANDGLDLPGLWRTDDWDVLATSVAAMLTTFPAEVRALGIGKDIAHLGVWPGAIHIDIESDPVLRLRMHDFNEPALPKAELADLGWIAESATSADPLFHSETYEAGEVDGRRLAQLLVDTAKLGGCKSPHNLFLTDHSQNVGDYWVEYYALTLRTAP
jgi:hypothetical protein